MIQDCSMSVTWVGRATYLRSSLSGKWGWRCRLCHEHREFVGFREDS